MTAANLCADCDPLRGARGIIRGLALSLALYGAIYLIVRTAL